MSVVEVVVVVVWRVSCRRNGLGGEVHQNTSVVERVNNKHQKFQREKFFLFRCLEEMNNCKVILVVNQRREIAM